MKTKKITPINLSFDQYQRYRFVADIIEAYRKENTALNFTILEVGSSAECVLSLFLPKDKIVNLDLEFPDDKADDERFRKGNFVEMEILDEFDFVLSLDVFEHIIPLSRNAFIEKSLRLAKIAAIITCPFSTEGVCEAEEIVNNLFEAKFGEPYHWLEEHIANGLPSLEETQKFISECGCIPLTFPNGYLPRWFEMISITLQFHQNLQMGETLYALNRFYNRNFYQYDNNFPSYRHIVLMDKTGNPPKNLSTSLLTAMEPPAQLLERLNSILGRVREMYETFRISTEVADFKTVITELNGRLSARETQLSERDNEIQKLSGLLSERDTRIQELSGRLSERDIEIRELYAKYQVIHNDLQVLLNTKAVLIAKIMNKHPLIKGLLALPWNVVQKIINYFKQGGVEK